MSIENVSKNDFLFFQNDILKDIKILESTMNNKISQINQTIVAKINEHDSKISKLTENINELLSIYTSRKHDNENIEELLKMRRTINDSLLDCKTQINLVNRCVNNAISKYDTIIIDNLSLPGIVGINCKFKNFREYLEFIHSELKANNLFKEQQLLNTKKYKEKLENLIKKEEIELREVTNKTNKICNAKFEQYEKLLEEKFNYTQEVIQSTRVDNSKYAMSLIEKTEELQIHYDKLKGIKNEIYEEYEKELEKFRKEVEKNTKIFSINQNDFKLIKQRFTQLSEFIKDVRFQKNIKNFSKMAKNIDFTKKQKYNDDYNMELYNEITKDLIGYLNGEKDEEEKNQIKLKRTRKRTSSLILNQLNKEQIKNSIITKYRNSTQLNFNNVNKMDMNKISPIKKKRNSIVFQQNEYNEMKKNMILDTTIKEEDSLRKKTNKNLNYKINTKNKENKEDIISFSKSDLKPSSSSSSSSLYSSRSQTSSKKDNEEKNIEENKNQNQKEIKKDLSKNFEENKTHNNIKNDVINQKDKDNNQVFRTIKIQSKKNLVKINNKKDNNNKSKADAKIKEIREEYGNKARLISMDLMASNQYKPRYSKNDLSLGLNIFSNNINFISGNHKLNNPSHNYFSNKNLNITTNNNLFINKQINNNNSILPNIHIYSEKKKEKTLLLFQNNNNINKKNNICITDLNNTNTNKEKKIIIQSLSDKNDNNNSNTNKNKNVLINDASTNNELNIKEENSKINNEYSSDINKTIKNNKYFHKDLVIQNVDKFIIEKIEIKEKCIINKINDLNIIQKDNNKNESNNTKSINNDNNNTSYDFKLIEHEFEKVFNEKTISFIKEQINKININNEALNTKISFIEERYNPIMVHIDEIFNIITLIYNTIKKDKNNQTLTIIQTKTNINKFDSNRIKINDNLRNKIFKDYLNKKGINLTYPSKKESLTIDKNKTKLNEENNNTLGNNDCIKITKDDINLLLNKIEPFLIKKFKK